MKTFNTRQQSHISSTQKLQDYLGIVVRGKWILLGAIAAGVLFAIVFTIFATRVYKATAGVKIDMNQLQSSIFRDNVMSYAASMNIMQNEIEVLKSNTLALTAAKMLREERYLDSAHTRMINIIQPTPEDRGRREVATDDQIMFRLKGVLDFEPVRESDVIKITAMSKDPREAALIANTYARAYFERNLYASRTKSRTFREFLENQVKEKQSALAHAEDSLRHYMEQSGTVSLDEESQKMVNQMSQLEAQRDAVTISVQSLEKTISGYREQVSEQEANVAKVIGEANDPYIRSMQDQLAQLEVTRDVTVAQNPAYAGKEVYSAKLNEIDEQIKALKAKLKTRTDQFLVNLVPGASTGSEARDPAGYLKQVKQRMLEAQIELQSEQAKLKALEDAIADYNKQFERLPKKSLEYARLQRSKMSLEKLYLLIQEKYNEANITEQGELGYIDIFDPAMVPFAPSSPKPFLNLLLGLMGGLALGVTYVFGMEYLNEKIRTPDDLKKRAYNLLATVTTYDTGLRGGKGKKDVREKIGAGHRLVMLSNALSPAAEAYRHLRTTLHRMRHDGAASQSILVTSAQPGEGKTTTASNLAIAFARAGQKVLLVDADLRQPAVHTAFGFPMTPGLSDHLLGNKPFDQVVRKTTIPDLSVLTSGEIPSNPSEVLGSKMFTDFISEAERRFEILVLDTPPLLAVTDASILATEVDRLILVVSSGRTEVKALEAAKDMLESVDTKITGAVLNNFNLHQLYGRFGSQTAYGYYQYSGYGQKPQGTNGRGEEPKVRDYHKADSRKEREHE
jgi:capsular exopolysaccharide synthesis family protein